MGAGKVNTAMSIVSERALELQAIVKEMWMKGDTISDTIQKIWGRGDFTLNEKLFSIYGFGRTFGR